MKTRDVIIDKAIELFSTRGYNGSSVRDICREVGIKESSFYNHFISKEALRDTIFEMCQQAMIKSVLSEEEREKLTNQYTLREILKSGVDKFIHLWADTTMSRMWNFLSMEQYINPVAGRIILDEDIRKITGAAATFDKLQMKGKMKACNSLEVSHLYMYSIRAQHLDYGLRLIHELNAEQTKQMMYRTCDLICTLYEV